jgi:hypothetical protein
MKHQLVITTTGKDRDRVAIAAHFAAGFDHMTAASYKVVAKNIPLDEAVKLGWLYLVRREYDQGIRVGKVDCYYPSGDIDKTIKLMRKGKPERRQWFRQTVPL